MIPESMGILALETVRFERHGSNMLRVIGVMAMPDPAGEVGPWFRQLHEHVKTSGVREFTVDATGLTFVNSSSIRVFVRWLEWMREDDAAYVIMFKIAPSITWQPNTFAALRALDSQRVRVVTEK